MLSGFIQSFIHFLLFLSMEMALSHCPFCIGHTMHIEFPWILLACHPFKCFINSQAIHRRQNHIIARASWVQDTESERDCKKHNNWKVGTTLGTVTISKATKQSQRYQHQQTTTTTTVTQQTTAAINEEISIVRVPFKCCTNALQRKTRTSQHQCT